MKVSHSCHRWVHLNRGSSYLCESQEAGEGRLVEWRRGPELERSCSQACFFPSWWRRCSKLTAVDAAWCLHRLGKKQLHTQKGEFYGLGRSIQATLLRTLVWDGLCVCVTKLVEWESEVTKSLASLLWLEEGELVGWVCRKERDQPTLASKIATLGHCVFEREPNTQVRFFIWLSFW